MELGEKPIATELQGPGRAFLDQVNIVCASARHCTMCVSAQCSNERRIPSYFRFHIGSLFPILMIIGLQEKARKKFFVTHLDQKENFMLIGSFIK